MNSKGSCTTIKSSYLKITDTWYTVHEKTRSSPCFHSSNIRDGVKCVISFLLRLRGGLDLHTRTFWFSEQRNQFTLHVGLFVIMHPIIVVIISSIDRKLPVHNSRFIPDLWSYRKKKNWWFWWDTQPITIIEVKGCNIQLLWISQQYN